MKNKKTLINGVEYLTERQDSFSEAYTKVREIEGRILSDEAVKRLPYPFLESENYQEWQLRQKSTERFTSYLKDLKTSVSILDVGCGNGWFSNAMAIVSEKNSVIGIDLNTLELEQAARIFNKKNLRFMYADIFEASNFFIKKYDIITLNASIQYFEDIELLLSTLKSFLRPKGEIHILDSPFYDESEIENAKKRTQQYYKSVGAPEMSKHYFHHSNSVLERATVLYSPKKGIFKKLFFLKDVPFYWIKLIK